MNPAQVTDFTSFPKANLGYAYKDQGANRGSARPCAESPEPSSQEPPGQSPDTAPPRFTDDNSSFY